MAVPKLFGEESKLPNVDIVGSMVNDVLQPDSENSSVGLPPREPDRASVAADVDVLEPTEAIYGMEENSERQDEVKQSDAQELRGGEQQKDGEVSQGVDEQIRQIAKEEYGLSDSEIDQIGDSVQLMSFLGMMDRRIAQMGQQAYQGPLNPQQPEQPFTPPSFPYATQQPLAAQAPVEQPTVTPAPQPQPIPAKLAKLELKLDKDMVEEPVVEAIQKLNDHYYQALQNQQQVIETLVNATLAAHQWIDTWNNQYQQQAEREAMEQADQWFESLGPDWVEEFGSGPTESLPQGSRQRLNRERVLKQAESLAMGLSASGRNPGSARNLIQRAFGSLYFDKMREKARGDMQKKMAERRDQGIARASWSTKKTSSGYDEAIRVAREFAMRHGLPVVM